MLSDALVYLIVQDRRKLPQEIFHAPNSLLLHKNTQILIIIEKRHIIHPPYHLYTYGPHIAFLLQRMGKPLLNKPCMCIYICAKKDSKKCLTTSDGDVPLTRSFFGSVYIARRGKKVLGYAYKKQQILSCRATTTNSLTHGSRFSLWYIHGVRKKGTRGSVD